MQITPQLLISVKHTLATFLSLSLNILDCALYTIFTLPEIQ